MHSPNVSQGDAVLCDGPPKHQISGLQEAVGTTDQSDGLQTLGDVIRFHATRTYLKIADCCRSDINVE